MKTTYRKHDSNRFSYTLGIYTSYIRTETERKSIVFLYSDYGQHSIIGFVYKRTKDGRNTSVQVYSFDTLQQVSTPFEDVEVFMRGNWS